MRFDFRAYRALAIANFKMGIRNPAALVLGLVLPIAIIGFSSLSTSRPGIIRVDLVNRGPDGSPFVRLMRTAGTFKVTSSSDAAARRDLEEGRTDVEVVIPADLGATDAAGQLRPAQVRLLYNPARSDLGRLGGNLVAQLVNQYDDAATHAPHPVVLRTDPIARTRNPSTQQTILTLALLYSTVSGGIFLVPLQFIEYKSKGMLRRIQATPTNPLNFTLSQASSELVVSVLRLAAVVAAGIAFLQLSIGQPLLLAATLLLGIVTFMGIGYALVARIANAQQANGIVSGAFFLMVFSASAPPGELPSTMAKVVGYLPSTMVNEAVRQAVSQTGGFAAVAGDLAGLAAWGLGALILTVLLFRWE